MPESICRQLEDLIRRDPAGRGLISSESRLGPLCPGHLAHAARSLAETARRVMIVTGFFVPEADPPAAETDGPPGAIVLADVLRAINVPATIVTDARCAPALEAAAWAAGIDPSSLLTWGENDSDGAEDQLRSEARAEPWTHIIAIERVGPSHDEESFARQPREGAAPVADFRRCVPPENRNRCFNMRGTAIDECTAPLHRLFERSDGPGERPTTIGIADGGNEIGMGSIAWEELARRLPPPTPPWVICRVPTDWTIVAGTSNWGAFALAAATLALRGRTEALVRWTPDLHRHVLESMVSRGSAVDGMTRRPEATVDGLPFETYIQCWIGIERLLGLR